jgi:hypothetical protein
MSKNNINNNDIDTITNSKAYGISVLIFIVLIILLLLNSCVAKRKCCNYCRTSDTLIIRDTFKLIQKDTIFNFEPDVAFFEAWLECDSNNNVLLSKLNTSSSGAVTRTVFRDNYIKVDFACRDSVQLLKRLIKEYESKSNNKVTVKQEIVMQRSKWTNWLFGWFLITVAVGVWAARRWIVKRFGL